MHGIERQTVCANSIGESFYFDDSFFSVVAGLAERLELPQAKESLVATMGDEVVNNGCGRSDSASLAELAPRIFSELPRTETMPAR